MFVLLNYAFGNNELTLKRKAVIVINNDIGKIIDRILV